MVLAKGTSVGGTKGSGYVHGMSCISMIDPPEIGKKDESFFVEKLVVAAAKEKKIEESTVVKTWNTCSSSSTSSIGNNSDVSGRSKENSGDTDEVQSPYKAAPLDGMEALEKVLPMRRGISNFYNGKSKSFACLADASSTSSPKELAKPENAYMRRRRNLLASGLVFDHKNRSSPLRSNGGGVSKRVNNQNRSTLGLGGSPSSVLRARIHSQLREYYHPNGSSSPSPPGKHFSAWRSLSLLDLQHCVPGQSDTDGCHT